MESPNLFQNIPFSKSSDSSVPLPTIMSLPTSSPCSPPTTNSFLPPTTTLETADAGILPAPISSLWVPDGITSPTTFSQDSTDASATAEPASTLLTPLSRSSSEGIRPLYRLGAFVGGQPTPTFTLSTQLLVSCDPLLPLMLRQVSHVRVLSYPIGDVLTFLNGLIPIPNPESDTLEATTALSPPSSISPTSVQRFGDSQGFIKHLSLRNNMSVEPSIYGKLASLQVCASSGRVKVTVRQYAQAALYLQPMFLTALSEELPAVCCNATDKYQKRIIEDAEAALISLSTTLLQHSAAVGQSKILANLQGGCEPYWRRMAAYRIVPHFGKHIEGVSIGGLGYGETLQVRTDCLQAQLSVLPQAYMRVLPLGCGNPIEILHAVLMGVDCIQCSYPLTAAKKGWALAFSTHSPHSISRPNAKTPSQSFEEAQKTILKLWEEYDTTPYSMQYINLYDPNYKSAFYKLTEASCVQESCAYIHHLLICNEMLAFVLLALHNLNLYAEFFEAIRYHIESNSYFKFIQWFLHQPRIL